jgi:hypothetical protein
VRRLSFILLALAVSLPAFAAPQCVHKVDVIQNKNGIALAGVGIRLCSRLATGTPCNLPVTVYSDYACSSVKGSVTTNVDGVYDFYVAPGTYQMQATAGVVTKTYADFVVSPADAASGQWTLTAFKDDGTSSGVIGLLKAPRDLTLVGVRVRATKPWVACSTAATVTVAGRAQSSIEGEHVYATLSVQNQVRPSGQTTVSYVLNADTPVLAQAIPAGDELKIKWSPASGCTQYGDGVLISLNYEGTR